MPKEEPINKEGIVTQALANAIYRVTLDQGHEIIASPSGKMRRSKIKIVEGDKVKIVMSPYNMHRGRITFRL